MSFSNLGNDDWQKLIYLSLILIALFSGVFSRSELPFKKILHYLAIWSLVAIFGISIYSYRYDFSDFKNRILGELFPSTARENLKTGKLIINIARDGHFYLDTRVNGNSMRFMIDTGASSITIGIPEAKRLGINISKLNFNKVYQTANGKSFGAGITLDEIEVGNILFQNISASINSSDMGTPLLGMNFLRQFEKYEFYRDKLILTIR